MISVALSCGKRTHSIVRENTFCSKRSLSPYPVEGRGRRRRRRRRKRSSRRWRSSRGW